MGNCDDREMAMRTIVVTGGSGFIGSHFVRQFLDDGNFRVVNIDKLTYAGQINFDDDKAKYENRTDYKFVHGDICDVQLVDQLFESEKPWAIVNFAAESHVDRSITDMTPFLNANILGVHNLLNAAKKHDVARFLQISTDEVYGDTEPGVVNEEDALLAPGNPYSASKASADLICQAFARTHDLPILIARCTNNYGPKQYPEKLIPFFVLSSLRGNPLPLYGDGQQQRDWIYVDDAVRAIKLVLTEGRVGTIYNICTGAHQTNLEIATQICNSLAEIMDKAPEDLISNIKYVKDRPGHDRRYAMSSQRITDELGWSPTTPVDVGLQKTVRWYFERFANDTSTFDNSAST